MDRVGTTDGQGWDSTDGWVYNADHCAVPVCTHTHTRTRTHTHTHCASLCAHLVKFIITSNSEQNVSRVDTTFLVVMCGIASELQHLGTEVLQYSRSVHWGSHRDALLVHGHLQCTVEARHREDDSCPVATGDTSPLCTLSCTA